MKLILLPVAALAVGSTIFAVSIFGGHSGATPSGRSRTSSTPAVVSPLFYSKSFRTPDSQGGGYFSIIQAPGNTDPAKRVFVVSASWSEVVYNEITKVTRANPDCTQSVSPLDTHSKDGVVVAGAGNWKILFKPLPGLAWSDVAGSNDVEVIFDLLPPPVNPSGK